MAMTDALSNAIGGLRAAAAQAETAAQRVVRSASEATADTAREQPGGTQKTAASHDAPKENPAVIVSISSASKGRDDLFQGVLDFQAAAMSYMANARATEAASRTEETLLQKTSSRSYPKA